MKTEKKKRESFKRPLLGKWEKKKMAPKFLHGGKEKREKK